MSQPVYDITIGRSPQNDVAIADDSVSKEHVRLIINEDGTMLLSDLGSRNGTFRVNGRNQEMIFNAAVMPDDVIQLGSCEVTVQMLLETYYQRVFSTTIMPDNIIAELLKRKPAPAMNLAYESRPAESLQCPKCGSDQVRLGECMSCGIIVSKYLQKIELQRQMNLQNNHQNDSGFSENQQEQDRSSLAAYDEDNRNKASYVQRHPPTHAGFWKRFAASFIDGIITMIGGYAIGFFYGLILAAGGTNDPAVLTGAGNFLGLVLGWLYFAVMESSSAQATLGKMALGIKVTDLVGNKIGFGQATGRYFGKIISTIILFIGFIMVAFTEKKQGLHDIMAGCLVVNK